MTLAITPLYAAPLVLVFIALSVHVLTYRRSHRIALGDAGDRELLNRIRAHGNFAEYAPISLLVLMMAELSGASPVWLHVTGAMMVGGRLIHAAHLALYPTTCNLRPPAVVLTLTGLLLGAALALVG